MRAWRFLLVLIAATAYAQTEIEQLPKFLEPPVHAPNISDFQVRQYIIKKAASLPAPLTPADWTAQAKRLREHLVNDVVLHGWPREWVDAPAKFEDLGLIPSGKGYRMRKLRYEIIPGFQSVAILYEPETVTGKAPAILNVNGHVGVMGKSIEYKQKRCINFAKRGIYALNLDWIGMGELSQPENSHFNAAHLELVGANADGLHYLALKKALDYLAQLPNVDPSRLGMTGMSGGGWQTFFLSGLDERVWVSVPNAGWGTVQSALERDLEVGCNEMKSSDSLVGVDASTFVAMRAPRPTLLICNAEDFDYPAAFEKTYLYDPVRPFFRLFGHEDRFEWHENTDPGNHNYQLDNRLAAYRFFAKWFDMPAVESEIPVGSEIKSFEEQAVGLPKDNLTMLGVAKKLADRIERAPVPAESDAKAEWRRSQTARLKKVVRYQEVGIDRAWGLFTRKHHELETRSYRFDFNNGLSATGVWLKAIYVPENAPATLVLNDEGKKASALVVSERLNREEQVLAADLVFTGDMKPSGFLGSFPIFETPSTPAPYFGGTGASAAHLLCETLAAVGDRPLGIEAAQLISIVRWLQKRSGVSRVRLESVGIRSQVISLTAAALEPGMFSEVIVHDGMSSLRHLLDAPVEFSVAPDLFCLDLYKEFDLDRLAEIAAPVKIRTPQTQIPIED